MFSDIFSTLLARVEGAEWAMVVGLDGIVLESTPAALAPRSDQLAAEYAALVRASQRATAQLGAGTFRGSLLFAAESKIVLEILTPEYFLAMGLSSAGHAARARFEIGRARDLLERELVF
jgi:predicted regulator of Ras-like GTPase activity (Roadblock/LC7/MglB family)